ncbi:MAG: VWA domain-containing protein [Pyrinomonadaceae bacterium]|nr:VWA domain-containing protein [Pyrinomonadaceae bacterium]
MKEIGKKSLKLRLACFLPVFFIFLIFNVQAQEDVIKVETDLISFEATITDANGKPVRGLEAKDFKIFENGIERKIDFFEPIRKSSEESRPLSIVFALDVSGSVTNEELIKLRNALQDFINHLADYNSYFAIMSFGMEVKTLQGFTNKPDKLEKTFSKLLKEQEGLSTHAYDATDDAIRLLQRKAPRTGKNKLMKRAVILITDGFPVGDTVTPRTVIDRANDSETSIYTIILPSFSRLQGNQKPLPTPLEVSGLVERTGGRSLYANDRNFEPIFKSLEEELTASYALAFYPSDEARQSGKFYEVKIEVANGLKVKQNRAGYQVNK